MPKDAADQVPDHTINEVFGGRYDVFEPIGQGGMSTVYRGRDRALDRPVAIKVIRHDPATHHDREHLRERFRREAANAARIPPHPNVVQIYDYGTDAEGDRDFIAMELLSGRDLKAAMRERRFSTADSVRILREAARGLGAGHKVRIVHRDVKPANLLLSGPDSNGSVKVLDFGIAKALEGEPEDDLTQVGGVPHTPSYASPEQLAGGRALGPASDVYQLGLVAYELLAGERPFNVHDRERIRSGEKVSPPVRGRWAELPASLRAVVERALQTSPEDRYPDAEAFAEALAAAEEEDRTLAVPLSSSDATVIMESGPREARSRGTGLTLPTRGRWNALPGKARMAVAVVLGLLLLWAVQRMWTGGSPDGDPALDGRSTAELEEQFVPLYGEAAERLAEDDEEP